MQQLSIVKTITLHTQARYLGFQKYGDFKIRLKCKIFEIIIRKKHAREKQLQKQSEKKHKGSKVKQQSICDLILKKKK